MSCSIVALSVRSQHSNKKLWHQSNYSSRIIHSHISAKLLFIAWKWIPIPETIRNFPRWRSATILDVIEMEIAPIEPPIPKNYRTKHEVDQMTSCGDIAIRNFPNERSASGRQSTLRAMTHDTSSSSEDLVPVTLLIRRALWTWWTAQRFKRCEPMQYTKIGSQSD